MFDRTAIYSSKITAKLTTLKDHSNNNNNNNNNFWLEKKKRSKISFQEGLLYQRRHIIKILGI